MRHRGTFLYFSFLRIVVFSFSFFNPEGQVNVTKRVFSISPVFSLLEVSMYTCIFLFDSSIFIKYHGKYVLKYTNPGDTVTWTDVDHHAPLESPVSVSTSLFSIQAKISMFRQ